MPSIDDMTQGRAPKTLILCDFDGTISTKDTVNRLVRDHLESPEWRFHVKRYLLGEIGSKEVYEAFAPMMSMTREHLDEFVLKHAALDPGFPPFLEWARRVGADVKVVSDGFDQTIKTLLRRHGIDDLEIYANSLILRADGSVAIENPFANPPCGICGTCKLEILRKFRESYDKIIVVGDGESDRHAASEADLVLALKDLFIFCARQGIPAIGIRGFEEIPRLLTRQVEAVVFDMDGTLIDSLDSIAEACNHMFRTLGYPELTSEQIAGRSSLSLLEFVKSFLRPDETEIGIKIFRDYYEKIYLETTPMIPGASETIFSLDGTVVQGVITNKRGKYARRLAEHLGFAKKMVRIIGVEDGYRAKPSADMFDEFIESTGVSRENTIYVGDSPGDIEAARNAGVDAYAVAGPVFSAETLALRRPRRVLKDIALLIDAIKPVMN